jgi:hypothetical protein
MPVHRHKTVVEHLIPAPWVMVPMGLNTIEQLEPLVRRLVPDDERFDRHPARRRNGPGYTACPSFLV